MKRVDRNQPEIVAALRAHGASVQTLHEVGKGCPDLVVGLCGVNLLMEVKDWQQRPSARRLTEDEMTWHGAWRGRVLVVQTIDEALEALRQIMPFPSGWFF